MKTELRIDEASTVACPNPYCDDGMIHGTQVGCAICDCAGYGPAMRHNVCRATYDGFHRPSKVTPHSGSPTQQEGEK